MKNYSYSRRDIWMNNAYPKKDSWHCLSFFATLINTTYNAVLEALRRVDALLL